MRKKEGSSVSRGSDLVLRTIVVAVWLSVILPVTVLAQTPIEGESHQLDFENIVPGAAVKSVSVDGNYAAVGSPDQGINGVVYLFEKDVNGLWVLVTKIIDTSNQTDAEFGASVAISADYLVVGSPGYDATIGSDAGRTTIYDLDALVNQNIVILHDVTGGG